MAEGNHQSSNPQKKFTPQKVYGTQGILNCEIVHKFQELSLNNVSSQV